MAQRQHQPVAPSGSALLSSALMGALAGAGGLAWWLWRQSQRRREAPAEGLRALQLRGGLAPKGSGGEGAFHPDGLPDRVQQLNQAIDEVRKQLEALQSKP
jgi:hypothetical protein